MTEPFDPYRHWLAIPAAEQPANHYRLLGLAPFEQDLDAISTAAARQMALVRTFQAGPHSALSQKLLNELATARLCLLNQANKITYDAQLKARLGHRMLSADPEQACRRTGSSQASAPAQLPAAPAAPLSAVKGQDVCPRVVARALSQFAAAQVSLFGQLLYICRSSAFEPGRDSSRLFASGQASQNPDQPMPATRLPYVDELLAARSDETRCCFICDSGQAGATVLYRDDRWLIVQHFHDNAIATANQIALVTLDELADLAALDKLALATNFENEPLWLVDVQSLAKLNRLARR
jgi:hypothetical protein